MIASVGKAAFSFPVLVSPIIRLQALLTCLHTRFWVLFLIMKQISTFCIDHLCVRSY